MIWCVIALPLVGAVLNGFVLNRASKLVSHIVASAVMLAAFACACSVFLNQILHQEAPLFLHGFDWIQAGGFKAPFGLILDPLSGLMMMIITGIGSLIHIYAGGYMHEEEKTYRFFSYLNFFVFMMLLLVLGDNLLVMFVGWEGVGLCSYLLIGYWFQDDKNAAAGMKAFLVNRIGDIGFLLGIFLCYKYFGTISFQEIKAAIANMGSSIEPQMLSAISLICFCLFLAACGKSAQFPLYVWLPDAMAGPTPVSALIHAATMVTAGIVMMTRLNFLFYLAPSIMNLIAWTGAFTAIFAASIGIAQMDIKKVLAYSTVSQLGFMVMACGVGAFDAGVFHLFTHACFKALLFMGAGSVIVAMHHEQDMRKMGGLAKYMPITHIVILVGVLAIIGFPGLAGFFSKDEILWKAYLGGGFPLWGVGVMAAGCTSFYMVRLLCLTFYGKNRSDHHTQEHLHETSAVMWAPLVVLAILSATVGYLGVPAVLGFLPNYFEHFLHSVIWIPEPAAQSWKFMKEHHSHALEFALMGSSIAIMLIASTTAIFWYRDGFAEAPKKLAKRFSTLYVMVQDKYRVDELYDVIFVQNLRAMSDFLFKIFDVKIIDGLVNATAHGCMLIAGMTSFKMTGSMQRYAMIIVLGIVSLLTIIYF